MTEQHPLARLLMEAACGRFPPADGKVEVVPSPPGRSDAVVAFSAHSVVAADVDPGEVLRQLPPDDLGAPMRATFLTWLGERLHTPPGMSDMVVSALPQEAHLESVELLPRDDLAGHPRVARAIHYRTDVRVYVDRRDRGVVMLGRGLAGRMEVGLEVYPAHRGAGVGRALARAALAVSAPGEPLFAQVTPGNPASVRAFLAAGYRPICSEVLFFKGDGA